MPLAPRVRSAALLALCAAPILSAAVSPDELLRQMTLEEKAGQLNQLTAGSLPGAVLGTETGEQLVARGAVGAVFNAVSFADTQLYQREAVERSRLHVPLLFGQDVIHGFRTIFPIPLGLSASWDPALIEATARWAAREGSAQGIRWTFSPMVDIARDPRWGRIAEGAGEDPWLGSAVAAAYVRGYQGPDLSAADAMLACAKHYVGYGATEGGRDYNTTEISEPTLRNTYLPPFRAAADAGALTFMSAFNLLNGVPSSANAFTLDRILRGEWKYRGFVDSDYTAVREIMLHGLADDEAEAARKSFTAGVDMDMMSLLFLPHLPELVRSGRVPAERLDDAVRRVLRTKAALGLLDHPYPKDPGPPLPALSLPARALARRAAAESFVLLNNRAVGARPLLPLSIAAGRRIALIGRLADSAGDMLGSWSCAGDAHEVVTLRRALAERCESSGLRFSYTPGSGAGGAADDGYGAAIEAAQTADVVVLAVGEPGRNSGEASSRSSLDLPGAQEQLLQGILDTGTPVVLIVFSGRPLALASEAENVPAMLWAWFPGGEAGPALVDTLFGDTNPSGRLTVSVPRAVGQVPVYYNAFNTGRPRGDVIGMGLRPQDAYYYSGYLDLPPTPLYPFGYGLSYTSYAYSPVRCNQATVSAHALNEGSADLQVSADIRNTGALDGTEVVQLYIRERGTSIARPVRELKGFRRLALRRGETQAVAFRLSRRELGFWSPRAASDSSHAPGETAVEPCSLYVWIGPDSTQGVPVKITVTP